MSHPIPTYEVEDPKTEYIHSHATFADQQKCWVSFGECWTHPNKKEVKDYSNRPSGSIPDMDSRSFLTD